MQASKIDINFTAVKAYASLPYRETPYTEWLNSCTSVAMLHWAIRAYPDRVHARQPMDDATIQKLSDAAKRVNGNMAGYAPTGRNCPISKHFGVREGVLRKAYKQYLGVDYYRLGQRFKQFPDTCIIMMADLKRPGRHVAAVIRGVVYDAFDSPSGGYIPLGVFQ